MTSDLGFLRPNPALFDLEARKRKPKLAHELGEGAPCNKCGDECPGFQLHYWRKVCQNCRCGKAEHNVIDDHDPGFYFVGKIFDRPLRSRREELEFCYGDEDEDGDDEGSNNRNRLKSRANKDGKLKMDWVPPNISKHLARKYLESLPSESVPIAGSTGAQNRKTQLERQFPMHDIEPDQCHDLSPEEKKNMESYIANVKENVVGQATVTELPKDDDDWFPPPPSPELLDELSQQLNKSATLSPGSTNEGGTFFARPVHGEERHVTSVTLTLGPKPFGSTSSSMGSSRNATPSPTSSNEDSHAPIPSLSRPSQFGNKPYIPRAGIYANPGAQNAATGRPSVGAGPLSPGGNNYLPMGVKKQQTGTKERKCVKCKETLAPGSVAIHAERAGPDMYWHPACFKCKTCDELLVDLLYYYEDGEVYCARDYAEKAKIPRCHACDELIFAAEYTGAENKVYHLKHFCCYVCDQPLAGHKYVPMNGQPHCLQCYQSKHGKFCKACGEYIAPEDPRLSLEGDHWHARPECFACAICTKSLLGQKMTRKFGMILCSSNCAREAQRIYDRETASLASSHATLV